MGAKGKTYIQHKKASKHTDNAFKRLKEMSCFTEFDRKVRAGISPESIAAWLQRDMHECCDVKRDSLVRQIYRYRRSLPPSAFTLAKPLYIEKAIETLERGIDELAEMEKLYLLQLKRVSIDCETEEKINKLFGGTYKEIQLAQQMLKDRMELKLELGLIDRAPQKLDVSGAMVSVGSNIGPEELSDETRIQLGVVAGKLIESLLKRAKEAKKQESSKETEASSSDENENS